MLTLETLAMSRDCRTIDKININLFNIIVDRMIFHKITGGKF